MPALSTTEFLTVDPLTYSDWDLLLGRNSEASFFHTTAWARVLHETYGHRPFYLCRIADGRVEQLLPIMEVTSRWTGCRGVSLPFTDVCPPIGAAAQGGAGLFNEAMALGRSRGWRYLECRGGIHAWAQAFPSISFYTHRVELGADIDRLFRRFDRSVRTAIRKATGGSVQVEFSRDGTAMKTFYSLHCQTRHRHGVPPQPFRFFDAISRNVLSRGAGFIATAWIGRNAIASAVYFHLGNGAIYKFGASNFRYQQLRPNNLVMWEAMKKLNSSGISHLHLGRTSISNSGLRRFKLGFGAREDQAEYARFDYNRNAFVLTEDLAEGWVNHVFRFLPMPLFRLAGSALYPHLS